MMAGLQRFNPQEEILSAGIQAQYQEKARTFANLSDKLSQWEDKSYKKAASARANQAQEDAVNDEMQGKEFHKESVYTVYGEAYNNTRKATYLANTELDLDTKSKELALKYQNDPEGYMNAFGAYIKETKKETNVPDIEMAIGLQGRKTLDNTYLRLQENAQRKQQASDIAQFDTYQSLKASELINAISAEDTKTADLIKFGLEEYTTSLMDSGTMTDAQFLKYKTNFDFTVKKGVMENEIEGLVEDGNLKQAGNLVKSFNKEIPEGFTPNQYDSIKSSINNTYNSAVKRQEAKAAKWEANQRKVLANGIKIMDLGKLPPNINELDAIASTMSSADRQEWELSKQAYQSLSQYGNLSLPEQQNIINTLENKESMNLPTIKLVGKMKSILKEKEIMIEKDPISLSIQDGINKPTQSISIGMDPVAFGDVLTKRADMAETNKLSYGPKASNILTDVEAKQFADVFNDVNTPIEDIIGMVQGIENSIPDSSNAIYKQMDKKDAPLLSYIGGLVKNGDTAKATKILKGRIIRKEFPNAIMEKNVTADVTSELGNAFIYGGQGQRKAVLEASLNYAATIAEETGKIGEYDDGKKALQSILGEVGTMNDQNYILPQGKSEGDVEDYIDDLTPDMFTQSFQGMTNEEAVKVIQNGQLISVGNGKYRVKYMNGFLYEEGNKPFVLEIK